ncbi:uncharacterized protein VICG_01346 [Vittaforma corneae ATCC 50505]|uniref:Sec23/Sec24 beta-sandwich domain-containing protein n=1 Tax=Vittaforma corneae (strain ATCC 50505) TaxID=993615 RepID=L2GL61_VITCO|nr:uncharacterized protein VICG_01346 [Vittaforma corneae ATCC 50505]ELA41598.1 hypothetical protein VICG_01346 [Vittaforma corneae ATCC 50505]
MQQNPVQNKKSIRVPDLPIEIYKDQTQNTTYSTSNPPPFLSTTDRLVSEKNNSDPSYLRSTMYTSPSSEFTLESCAMPFSIIANPFNEKGCLNFTSGSDICTGCRSYFNCFTRRDNTAFICNICERKNDSHTNYPENLKLSSFEYIISSFVERKPPHVANQEGQPIGLDYPVIRKLIDPVFVFMFDMCSLPLVEAILDSIVEIVQNENFQILYQNIGFFVINNGITTFGANLGKPVKYRMPADLPFISQKCTVPTKDLDVIIKILQEVRKINERAVPEANTIISTIKHISSFTSGCKVALVSSCPAELNYELILSDRKNCSVNLFCLYADINKMAKQHITLEKLSFYSSGKVYKYIHQDIPFAKKDLKNLCLSRSVFDVKLVLKVSDNLTKTSFVGSTLDDGLATSHLNHMDSSTSVLFNLGLNGPSKLTKYIQLQVSFTDFDGSRRMRVFNHSFPAGTPAHVFSSMSFDTLFASLVKLNISEDVKLEKLITDSLVYYRNKCSSTTSSSQFVLPDSIKCLPVLIQSYLKKTDLEKTRLINATIEQNLRHFYPRMFSLTEYTVFQNLEQTKSLRLTVNNISENDIYILENSQKIFIYIPKGVDRALVWKLFEECDGVLVVKEDNEEECLILNRIIEQIQLHYNYEMRVVICLAGESVSEGEFLLNMVEDKINNQLDYVDYIFKLHFDIQKS